ncbi:acetyl-CoA carboxylase biotin carboxyl carrier protein subunit [Flavobacterium soli]|uniref:acetyl-CoA carboxylase biotin carboxyl carrier protein subunit n=1 Tax=Flavobacterium soli TaxID=344881 RepID=UPI0003FD2ECB|nr:acetyl-CoA carboxylase biotin carboxyl carrier protein subunit [Flavobacterium soli]
MDSTYKLTVNGTTVYERGAADLTTFDAVATSTTSEFHVLKDNFPYVAEIVDSNFLAKTYTVKVNGNSYDVVITNPLDQLIKDMGFEVGASKQINSIKAPMPGLILEMSVTVGQEVQVNDCLLILEAMKMENSFLSPRSGIIKSISASKGDAVEKGQLLIEFE